MPQPDDATNDVLIPAAEQTRSTPGAAADYLETQACAAVAVVPDSGHFPLVPGYELLGVLGRGGMGVVFKARQLALNRIAAIKLIVGNASASQLIRFRQEAESVAKLQHPNIIQIFEVGSCPAGSFLALEYVEGGTLREKVAGVQQPPRVAAQMVETLARAIHHAHDKMIVHRDLKPANVLMTTDGVLKVADFGLARSLDRESGVTMTTDFVGTPAYAAPEQVVGDYGPVGPATDVYALGVILYELLVGGLPFEADSIPVLLGRVVQSEPLSPRRLCPELDRDLETICLKCLQKDPRKRYASAAEFADDLHHFLAGEPITARPVGTLERVTRWTRRNPAVASLLAAVFSLLVLLSVGGVIFSLRLGKALRTSEESANSAKSAAVEEQLAKQLAEVQRDAAQRAVRDGKEKLLQALTSEARAGRFSRRVGQRFATLDALRQAVGLARELGKPEATFVELRNLAVAALTLPDMKPDTAWVSSPTDMGNAWTITLADPAYKLTAIAHQQGTVSIRRIGTGPDDCVEVARIPGFGSEVSLGWSADGRHLAVLHWHTNYHRLQVWRIQDGTPLLVVNVPRNCLGFEFTPDGKQLIAIECPNGIADPRRTGAIYDLDGRKLIRSVSLPPGTGPRISHHPYRSELAIGLPEGVIRFDLNTEKEIARFPVSGLGQVLWHPRGELLSISFASHFEIWDTTRGRRNWRLDHYGEGLRGQFNQAGDLFATSGWSGRLRLWNPHTGRELLGAMGTHSTFGPDDRLDLRFPGSTNNHVGPLSVIEPAREYRRLSVGVGDAEMNGFGGVSLHPNGRVLAVACSQGLSLQDVLTGGELAFIRGPMCRAVLFEPDGSLLVKSIVGLHRWPFTVHLTDPTQLWVGPLQPVLINARGESIARSLDGTVLAASSMHEGAFVWRRDRPQDALRLDHPDCRHVAVSPSSKLVATGAWNGRGIKVWEVSTGRLLHSLLPNAGATVPAFSPDGRWLFDWRGDRWSTADWSEGPKPPAGVWFGGSSPDGRLEAWNGKGFVVLTETDTGRELVRLEDPNQDGLNGVVFSADGALLMGSTNDSFCVRIWDLRRLRRGLAELGLDWDAAPFPPAPVAAAPGLLRVRLVGEDLFHDSVLSQNARRDETLVKLWLNPFDADARQDLGDRLLQEKNPFDAAAQLNAAVAFRPDRVNGYHQRMIARFQIGGWAGVVADANVVAAKHPEDSSIVRYRGLALSRLGRHTEALPDLTASIRLYPNSPEAFLDRGEAYFALGKFAEAGADWKLAAERIGPTTREYALNLLAWRLLNAPPTARDIKRGLEIAIMAEKKLPGNAILLNTLGVAQYRNGLWKDAMGSLQQSLTVDVGLRDAFDLFFLAMCYAKLGDATNARDAHRRAVRRLTLHLALRPADADELKQLRAEAEATLHAAGIAIETAPLPRETIAHPQPRS